MDDEEEIEPVLPAEVRRRHQAYKEGKTKPISLEEVLAEEGVDPEAERLWAEEAERRFQEFLEGKMEAVPSEEALRRIRARLR